jgi:hypothetical protein
MELKWDYKKVINKNMLKDFLYYVILLWIAVILYVEASKRYEDWQTYKLCIQSVKRCNSTQVFVSCSPVKMNLSFWNYSNSSSSLPFSNSSPPS